MLSDITVKKNELVYKIYTSSKCRDCVKDEH